MIVRKNGGKNDTEKQGKRRNELECEKTTDETLAKVAIKGF